MVFVAAYLVVPTDPNLKMPWGATVLMFGHLPVMVS